MPISKKPPTIIGGFRKVIPLLTGLEGLEPPTLWSVAIRSNPLSYKPNSQAFFSTVIQLITINDHDASFFRKFFIDPSQRNGRSPNGGRFG